MANAAGTKRVQRRKRKSAKMKLGKSGALNVLTAELKPRTDVTTLLVGKKDARIGKRAGGGTVIEKRVYGPDKRLQTVLTIDAGSTTFESDLAYAFTKNVERARRENKKKTGRSEALLSR
jgi:hypothetical protein